MVWTLAELADALGAGLDGPPGHIVARPAAPDSDDAQGIAFCTTRQVARHAQNSGVGAVIAPAELPVRGKPRLITGDPYRAFGRFLLLYRPEDGREAGRHPTAQVASSARVEPSAFLGAYVVVEDDVRIDSGAQILSFCHIGRGSVIGARTTLHPHVVLYPRTRVGRDCLLHAGSIVGSEGLGFFPGADGSWQKFPQVGDAELGDEVQLGAGTVVERGAFGTTRVGPGTKIGAQTVIGHNATIGSGAMISGQVGIAGSATIGDNVLMGGQAGVADHVTIADGVALGARAAALRDLPHAGLHFGVPARPAEEIMRAYAIFPWLPELLRRVQRLDARCEEHRKRS
ncbi:MAG: UDP-3-O-(3-hydroxymyristoyl)glucosamine N-acyltransferase [Streptosporangiaceae bacterium]|nr:UDP-3-O-(3-hydroxymyristoyl)glucosamine N-acyltransferase [Streptosporangiaceae bacterium]MBV9855077.1 UDP-3-O-(3-hydroxymyristoyl)glucosamine N-acyltransferase [Streptosporangiaceae bacterium]